ncbi:hypothetical protein AAKU55_000932 [Oxalobacteraceae bacterium GrIS 1.11]
MKKNTTTALLAILVAAAVSQTAQAAPVDITSVPTAITLLSNGSVNFGDKFKNNLKNDVFGDHFTFTTTGTNKLDLILTSTSSSALNGLNITGLGLYTSAGLLAAGGTRVTSGALDKWTLSDANLTAGSYFFKVSGNVVSNTGGAFGANGTLISAVPEPETYAMMLAGFGLLGFMARRRKNTV